MLQGLLAAVISLHVSGYAVPDSIDARTITQAYTAMLSVHSFAPPGHDSLLAVRVDSPKVGSLLSSFYRDHGRWFDYLVTNGRGFTMAAIDSIQPGVGAVGGKVAAAKAQAEFLRRLETDSQFNSIVVPAIARYLARSGAPVQRSLLSAEHRNVSIDTTMKVASRFFYPDILTPTRILTHVCTVINAVRELPRRDPALEAFIFAAIMDDIAKDTSYIDPDFRPAMQYMNDLDSPGASKEVRLSRAQGVMWAMMAKSTRLRELLIMNAKRDGDFLPFSLRGDRSAT
jgi:hypothetical protein